MGELESFGSKPSAIRGTVTEDSAHADGTAIAASAPNPTPKAVAVASAATVGTTSAERESRDPREVRLGTLGVTAIGRAEGWPGRSSIAGSKASGATVSNTDGDSGSAAAGGTDTTALDARTWNLASGSWARAAAGCTTWIPNTNAVKG